MLGFPWFEFHPTCFCLHMLVYLSKMLIYNNFGPRLWRNCLSIIMTWYGHHKAVRSMSAVPHLDTPEHYLCSLGNLWGFVDSDLERISEGSPSSTAGWGTQGASRRGKRMLLLYSFLEFGVLNLSLREPRGRPYGETRETCAIKPASQSEHLRTAQELTSAHLAGSAASSDLTHCRRTFFFEWLWSLPGSHQLLSIFPLSFPSFPPSSSPFHLFFCLE